MNCPTLGYQDIIMPFIAHHCGAICQFGEIALGLGCTWNNINTISITLYPYFVIIITKEMSLDGHISVYYHERNPYYIPTDTICSELRLLFDYVEWR